MKNLTVVPLFMLHRIRLSLVMFFLFASSISFQSCTPSMFFDATAYEAAQALKTQALNVMGLAVNPFSDHQAAVEGLTDKIDSHIDYEMNRGEKNGKLVDMWNVMMSPSNNLLGGFLQRWETRGQLSQNFVDEAKSIVSSNFDKILNVENGRKRSSLGN